MDGWACRSTKYMIVAVVSNIPVCSAQALKYQHKRLEANKKNWTHTIRHQSSSMTKLIDSTLKRFQGKFFCWLKRETNNSQKVFHVSGQAYSNFAQFDSLGVGHCDSTKAVQHLLQLDTMESGPIHSSSFWWEQKNREFEEQEIDQMFAMDATKHD